MQTLTIGARGLGLLVHLNWDLLLYICTIAVALAAGAVFGTFYL